MLQFNTYIITLTHTALCIQQIAGGSDYRQGLDYNILNIHISFTILTYFHFIFIIILYVFMLIHSIKPIYALLLNKNATYLSFCVVATGLVWSWSQ